MQSVVLILGVIFTTISFFATADEHDNYYLTDDHNIGTRREGEYYDAYPVSDYTSEVTTADDKQGIDEFALMAALPGVIAIMGVIAIAWAQANDHQRQQDTIDDEKTKQSNICTVVQAYSTDTTLTAIADLTGGDVGVAATNLEIRTRLNLIENKINALTSPVC